jgi:hypothetical protein
MVSAIILLLAVLTAGSIVGIFTVALLELNAIDEITDPVHRPAKVHDLA